MTGTESDLDRLHASGAVPPLPHNCGSWVIVNNTGAPLAYTVGGRSLTAAPGGALVETFDRATAERCAARGLGVATALAWLQGLNKTAGGAETP